MSRFLFIATMLILSCSVFAQSKQKIVYKKRQTIDLGALEIDGELISPGDFSISNEKERATELLFKRKNYNDRIRINIEYVF